MDTLVITGGNMKNSIQSQKATNLAINLSISKPQAQVKTTYDTKHKIAWSFINANNKIANLKGN